MLGGLLGKIFGSDKAIESTINSVSSGLDKLYYSDEEKADDAAKGRTEARQMIVNWMAATQGQNLARRLLALMVTTTWLLMYVAAMIGSIIGSWQDDPAKWLQSSELIGDYADGMSGAVMLILGFYFAAPHMSSIAEKALNNFGKAGK